MLLNQLVEVNQKGLVARAVSFSLMDVADKNLKLCEGFVFNHDSDANRAKNTTVGILQAIRHSFHSDRKPNVHLIVQDYGKGKSHFALTVANFFKHPYSSDEVQGILAQLRSAAGENSYVYEDLLAYKKLGNHLVLCLSAEDVIDMRKHFFKVLNQELEKHGITDTISQQNCREPLNFLQKLDGGEQHKAEAYLKTNFSTTLADVQRRLSENDFKAVSIAKEICIHVKDVVPDFSGEILIKDTIDELIAKYCGSGKRFNGILILFDELYEYLQKWSSDPNGAGGFLLQSITDACEKHGNKIALVSLTQRNPHGVTPPKHFTGDYNKLVSRIAISSSTYNPKASLELVFSGLLKKLESTSHWKEFVVKWQSDLSRKSIEIFGNYAKEFYTELKWKHEEFFKDLTIGCFPLHPLTSHLLCNLSFAQGRSVIDFIQKDVRDFILDQPVEKNAQLNLIYPVALVDAFEDNFINAEANIEFVVIFSDYKSSLNKLQKSSDINPDEILVLKALFLFYVSGAKLQKSERSKHEEILQVLTGLSPIRVNDATNNLCKLREVIYLNLADNNYRFYGGGKGIDELRYRISDEIKNQEIVIDSVKQHCGDNIGQYIKIGGITTPQRFILTKKLRSEDWFFKNEVYTDRGFRSTIQKRTPFNIGDQAGVVAYVIAENDEEISSLEREIKKLIEQHPYRDQIVVAIAQRPVGELGKLLLMQEAASKLKVQEFGAALTQLKDQYSKQIQNETKELFDSFKFYCHLIEAIPICDHNNCSIFVSQILENAYKHIPPIESSDKLYLKSGVGSKAVRYISKGILSDTLLSQSLETPHKSIVDTVFVNAWGLLKLQGQQYKVSVPKHETVIKAWNKISVMTDLGESAEKRVQISQIWDMLSAPPYGYNIYTFTILIVGWMAYHRNEVFIEGSFGIPQTRSEQIRVRVEPLQSWGSTNILDKPKEFINKWILAGDKSPLLIRRKVSVEPTIAEVSDYSIAKQKIEEVSRFFKESATPEKYQTLSEQYQSLEKACIAIEQQFEPVLRVENLIESTSISSWSDTQVFLDQFSSLQSSLKSVIEGGLTVTIAAEQDRRYKQAAMSALEKINEAIEIEGDRHTKLTTEESCGVHKANLTQAIHQLNQIENIPSRFIESLQKALEQTERVITDIKLSKEVDACKTQIQAIYATLSDTANQQDYLRIRNQIDTLANDLPNVQQTEIYRSIVDSIEEKQDFLVRQLAEWESQYEISMSRDQASSLQQKISTQSIRYTDELSRDRLQNLLEKLNNIVLERRTQENEKQGIQNLLVTAKAKLNDIKNTNSPLEYIKYYLQLSETKLDSSSYDEQIEYELGKIKSESFKLIEQRLSQIIDLCSRRLEENSKNYTQLKSLLPKLQDVAARSDELISFRIPLNNAIQELDEQYNLLQKRIHDNQVMASIRQHSLAKINTLHLCEETISEIETKHLELNFSEDHADEINNQIQNIREKSNGFIQSLNSLYEELSTVNDAEQLNSLRDRYHQRITIFIGSSRFESYQLLGKQIEALTEDIKEISRIQDLASVDRANNIASCDYAIAQIDLVKPTLLETERFALSIQSLKDSLIQRKQSYLSKLIEFRDGLNNAATAKEVKQVRKKLNDSSSLYQSSIEVQEYHTVATEADLLISLLQFFESQKIETSEDCTLEIARLNQWEQDNPEITPAIRSRVETKLEQLEDKRQEIQKVGRRLAESWFNRTQQKIVTVRETNEQSEKFSSSSNLIKQITKEINKHEDLLDESEKQYLRLYLEEAIAFCDEITRLDREEKIIAQFQELPIAQRMSLYERLGNYLNNTEDES